MSPSSDSGARSNSSSSYGDHTIHGCGGVCFGFLRPYGQGLCFALGGLSRSLCNIRRVRKYLAGQSVHEGRWKRERGCFSITAIGLHTPIIVFHSCQTEDSQFINSSTVSKSVSYRERYVCVLPHFLNQCIELSDVKLLLPR